MSLRHRSRRFWQASTLLRPCTAIEEWIAAVRWTSSFLPPDAAQTLYATAWFVSQAASTTYPAAYLYPLRAAPPGRPLRPQSLLYAPDESATYHREWRLSTRISVYCCGEQADFWAEPELFVEAAFYDFAHLPPCACTVHPRRLPEVAIQSIDGNYVKNQRRPYEPAFSPASAK